MESESGNDSWDFEAGDEEELDYKESDDSDEVDDPEDPDESRNIKGVHAKVLMDLRERIQREIDASRENALAVTPLLRFRKWNLLD